MYTPKTTKKEDKRMKTIKELDKAIEGLEAKNRMGYWSEDINHIEIKKQTLKDVLRLINKLPIDCEDCFPLKRLKKRIIG